MGLCPILSKKHRKRRKLGRYACLFVLKNAAIKKTAQVIYNKHSKTQKYGCIEREAVHRQLLLLFALRRTEYNTVP